MPMALMKTVGSVLKYCCYTHHGQTNWRTKTK